MLFTASWRRDWCLVISGATVYSSLRDPQVLNWQEVFSLSLIKFYSSKLLTLIPLEFHIEDTSLSSNAALKRFHCKKIHSLKLKNETRECEVLVDRRSEFHCPQGSLWISLNSHWNLVFGVWTKEVWGKQIGILTNSTHSIVFLLQGHRASCVAWRCLVAS